VRLNNKMAGGKEGGYTTLFPEEKVMTIYEAAKHYAEKHTLLIIFAGKDYGMGSSRDWAAKGTALLGVRVVVARSFERIHRSNLIGMGVLPLQFLEEESLESLALTGEELFSVEGLENFGKEVALCVLKSNSPPKKVKLLLRLDTPLEVEYYRHGGIMPYVLRQILKQHSPP